jgi:hypothetical protein
MNNKLFGLAALSAALVATSAPAAMIVTTTPGTNPYAGPGFTPSFFIDFESPIARWDRNIFTDSVGSLRAQPFGSTGGYASVGPDDGSPGTLDLTGLGDIQKISFIWGSVDSYNTLEVLGAGGSVLYTLVGNDIFDPANGNQTDPNTNPVVTLTVTGLRFSSTQNAFEFDNVAIGVPEPATWAMMIGGFGMIGFAARRARRVKVAYT